MNNAAPPKRLTPVSYPIAFDSNGRLVDVVDARRGSHYVCVHCGRRVAPSLGDKVQWHYRHLDVSSCSPRSDLLLETALKAIRAAFRNAASSGQAYSVSFPCLYCPARLGRDLTDLFGSVEIAVATAVGQRDRLVFNPVNPGAAPLEVIVLVGNDTVPSLGDEADPTVTVPVDWDGVATLSEGLEADQYIAPTPLLCRLCQLVESPRKSDAPLSPIAEDRYGDPLYSEMYNLVNEAAGKLGGLGFSQSTGKPYLLYRRFGGYVNGVVFADFGGLRWERIWQARQGRLYGQFSETEQGAGIALLSRIATICEVRGIPLTASDSQGAEP